MLSGTEAWYRNLFTWSGDIVSTSIAPWRAVVSHGRARL